MRKTIMLVLCLNATLLAGYVGYRSYKVWKQSHLVAMAHQFIARADGRGAVLCLRQALQSNPKNIEACRLMADLAEAGRSREAILLRSRVVELNPHSTKDRFALARTSLQMRDLISATNVLEGVDDAGRKTAEYHNLAGAAASTANRLSEAEAHFLEAARLEPTNAAMQMNLAMVRLTQTNAAAQFQARTSLTQLCANPIFRCQALRALVVDALRQGQTNSALALTQRLLEQTNSVFADRLLRLDALRAAHAPEFAAVLAGFQREAANAPAEQAKPMIHELATWQMPKTSPADVLAWLQSLPKNLQTNQPVALLIAQCQATLRNWRALQLFLQPQEWGNLEPLRHAFQTRALRGQDLASAAKSEWEHALKATDGRKDGLVMLLGLAVDWDWPNEGEEILWTIVKRFPGEKWALRTLSETLFLGGRTRSLMMLYSQQARMAPSDLGLKNNLAMTALLLGAQEMRPHELAREIFEKSPASASFVSTYAFSLHLLKKHAEALRVIEQLGPKQLEDPSISGYYGMILQAAGDRQKARKYLEMTTRAKLLPEERKLFELAKTG